MASLVKDVIVIDDDDTPGSPNFQFISSSHCQKRRKTSHPKRNIHSRGRDIANSRSQIDISQIYEDEVVSLRLVDPTIIKCTSKRSISSFLNTSPSPSPSTCPSDYPKLVNDLCEVPLARKSQVYPYFLAESMHACVCSIADCLKGAGRNIKRNEKLHPKPYHTYKLPRNLRMGRNFEVLGHKVTDVANIISKTPRSSVIGYVSSKIVNYLQLLDVYKTMCKAIDRQEEYENSHPTLNGDAVSVASDTNSASDSEYDFDRVVVGENEMSETNADAEFDLSKYRAAVSHEAYKLLDSKIQGRVRLAVRFGDLTRWFGTNEIIWCGDHLSIPLINKMTIVQWDTFIVWAERTEEGRQWRRKIQASWKRPFL